MGKNWVGGLFFCRIGNLNYSEFPSEVKALNLYFKKLISTLCFSQPPPAGQRSEDTKLQIFFRVSADVLNQGLQLPSRLLELGERIVELGRQLFPFEQGGR